MNTQKIKRNKLAVHYTNPGAFSFQLVCMCKTIGKETIERRYTAKKVNFYKFKEYVMTVKGVTDFDYWYSINKTSVAFLFMLSDYINYTENRTGYYQAPDSITTMLNNLISTVSANNNLLRQAIAQ